MDEHRIPDEHASNGGRLSPLDERVLNAIVTAIYQQQLGPGTKLGEQDLATAFCVSRARIRRVLLALFQQGLVELIPHRGAFVIEPTRDDARDIFSTRRALERLVIERIIANPDPTVTSELHSYMKAELEAENSGKRHETFCMMGEFHLKLLRLSGSRVLKTLLEPILLQSSLTISVFGGGRATSCTVEEHNAIVAAIASGDTENACDLMDDHLTLLEQSLRLDDQPVESLDFTRIFEPLD